MKIRNLVLYSAVVLNALFLSAYGQYNVSEFGTKGDGVALDTRSIQSAIDQAHENGGGVVEIPAGTYKIGTLILRDNINLHLLPGAVLLGSADVKDYTEIIHHLPSRTNGLYAKYFMLFAEDARNISITGEGTIHGNGLDHFQESNPQNLRPFMIRLVNCRDINIRDVKLLESANWTLHLLGCTDVNVQGIVIETTAEGNRDGLDIDACTRVRVANARIATTDDAIVMKATNDIMCQDITITNCILSSGGSGVKTGTESNGGFKNITVSNCVIRDIDRHAGIELMTVDGGIMQNILIENLTMERVATPFFIRVGIRSRPYKEEQYVNKIGEAGDIFLNNISVIDAELPSSIMGMHNRRISNVAITNYSVRYTHTQDFIPYNQVPFEEFSYPMARMFENLPACGLYCRNVDELHLNNINIYSVENEQRPALTFDRVSNLDLFSVKADAGGADVPMVHFRNTENVSASFCKSRGAGNTLFEIEDGTSSNLSFSNNTLIPGQEETEMVPPFPDKFIFEDFQTEIKYAVEQGEEVKGLLSHNLEGDPLHIKLNMTKRGSLQLCLLMLNDSPLPGKVVIKYEGTTQEFLVNWNEWGWAPITLLKQYEKDREVDFEIVSQAEGTELRIARAYLRYQDIAFTD